MGDSVEWLHFLRCNGDEENLFFASHPPPKMKKMFANFFLSSIAVVQIFSFVHFHSSMMKKLLFRHFAPNHRIFSVCFEATLSAAFGVASHSGRSDT